MHVQKKIPLINISQAYFRSQILNKFKFASAAVKENRLNFMYDKIIKICFKKIVLTKKKMNFEISYINKVKHYLLVRKTIR